MTLKFKLLAISVLLLFISGCATMHQSSESLKQKPLTTLTIHSDRNYQAVHKLLSERMKSCWSYSPLTASAELYPDMQLGVVQVYMSGAIGLDPTWIYVIETTASPKGGSDVHIYSSGKIQQPFERWVSGNTEECDPK